MERFWNTKRNVMSKFKSENLSSEEAFWVMWYFLKEHYDLSNNTFDVSDILGASQPIDWNGRFLE